jgi:hypothetical protein
MRMQKSKFKSNYPLDSAMFSDKIKKLFVNSEISLIFADPKLGIIKNLKLK